MRFSFTKMLLFLTAAVLVLSSCTVPTEPGAIFDYQKKLGDVYGVLEENGEEYEILLHFEEGEDCSVLRSLTYTAPPALANITVSDEGSCLRATLGDMSIPLEFAKKDIMLRAAKLFELKEEDVTDISPDENITVITGKNEDASWQAETGEDGLPQKITYSSKELSCTMKITKAELRD